MLRSHHSEERKARNWVSLLASNSKSCQNLQFHPIQTWASMDAGDSQTTSLLLPPCTPSPPLSVLGLQSSVGLVTLSAELARMPTYGLCGWQGPKPCRSDCRCLKGLSLCGDVAGTKLALGSGVVTGLALGGQSPCTSLPWPPDRFIWHLHSLFPLVLVKILVTYSSEFEG